MTATATSSPEYAGFGIRAVAYLIDYIPLGMIAFLINQSGAPGGAGSWIALLLFGAYSITTWSHLGGTLGQLASGIAVVDARSGAQVGRGQAAVRFLVLALSILPLGAGLVWAAFDRRHQGWHDKAAATYVVRRR